MTSIVVVATRGTATISRRRRCIYRLMSIGLGLSFFALLELVCVIVGWGESQFGDDPLVGFESVRPLFEKTSDNLNFHTSPARHGYFKEVSFTVRKPRSEFRIFVFGGSTVQGNPFSIETSFPTYLQVALEKADSSRHWKVINCGGVSYASHRLLPVMRECLNYQPDLFVFCGGHNQFLERISFEDVRDSAVITGPVFSVVSRFRSFRILHRTLNGCKELPPSDYRAVLPLEVDAALDHHDGLKKYHRDDELADKVAESFARDLSVMSAVSRQENVPLLFVLPPSNLGDCPPFKSEYSSTTTTNIHTEISLLVKQAKQLAANNLSQAILLLKDAAALDSRYALTWYELGQLQRAALDFSAAEVSFRRARDEDVCPLRMTTRLESGMRTTADATSVPLIDAHELLTRRCRDGIVGDKILLDHVHPSFLGNEDIALAIADWMISAEHATASDVNWKGKAVQECRDRLRNLDDLYFHRGQRALRSLRLWAAGRVDETPLVPAQDDARESQESR